MPSLAENDHHNPERPAKVCGFSFVRNAVQYDYPVIEAIHSILPVCDEFIVAVGNSADGTRKLIESINDPKIRIIDTVWDDNLREGGRVLAVETNKAFDAVAEKYDWAFYIQADEVMHERYLPVVKEQMQKHLHDPSVEGLLFNYTHFFGSYDYVGDSRRWYRHEIRIIRNNKKIRSYRDAQGFRLDGRKLNVKKMDAWIYHYGWVKPPESQQAKHETFHRYWHDDNWIEQNIAKAEKFDYSFIDSLEKFKGTHPAVIRERIKKMNWQFDMDISRKNMDFWAKILYYIEKWTGYRPGEYKNYRIL